jgi:hypothetical protein
VASSGHFAPIFAVAWRSRQRPFGSRHHPASGLAVVVYSVAVASARSSTANDLLADLPKSCGARQEDDAEADDHLQRARYLGRPPFAVRAGVDSNRLPAWTRYPYSQLIGKLLAGGSLSQCRLLFPAAQTRSKAS